VNGLTVGARIYNRGDQANDAKFGTVSAVEDGHVSITYDDGTANVLLPVVLFSGERPRLRVVHVDDAPPIVGTFAQQTATGRHVRMATLVRFADGRVVRFMDRIGKRAAVIQARAVLARDSVAE
jgi:hypothetical protein